MLLSQDLVYPFSLYSGVEVGDRTDRGHKMYVSDSEIGGEPAINRYWN